MTYKYKFISHIFFEIIELYIFLEFLNFVYISVKLNISFNYTQYF